MNIIRCLIVDDEPIARQIIASYCQHLPYIEIVKQCANAIEAKSMIQQEQVDLLFLDINMPVIDGISFLKTLRKAPYVILTTAYKEYALDGYDLAVCDYLLKPFSFERFLIAVDKVVDKLHPSTLTTGIPTDAENFIFIKYDGKIFKVEYKNLLYAEAQGNNIKLVLHDHILYPTMTFASLEELLPPSVFIRLHRSYIINKSKISHIEGNRVFIEKNEIPIGANYKEMFLKEIGF